MDSIDTTSAILVPLFVGAGVTLTLSPSVPAEFWAARACFIASGLIAAGWGCYWLVTTDMRIGWKLGFACLLGATCLPSLVGLLMWVDFRADIAAPDVLTPANLPQPSVPSLSQVPPEERPGADSYLVYFGTNVSWFSNFPHTILQMGEVPMIVIDKDERGNIVLSVLRLFDKDGKILARVENNGFWLAGSTRKSRPSKSILRVFDDEDKQVLSIHLLNKKCLEVQGIFNHKGSLPVIITDSNMEMNGNYWLRSIFNSDKKIDIGVN